MKQQSRAILFALASVLCWSTVATAFKLTLGEVGVMQLVLYSSLASLLVLLLALLPRPIRRFAALRAKDVAASALMGFLNPFAYYLVLFTAYDVLPAQQAQPLNYTWPIVLSIMAALFLKQRLRAKDLVAMLLSLLGVVVISTRGNFTSLESGNGFGIALALGSSLIWASYWILNMRSTAHPTTRLALNFFFGSLYSVVAATVLGAWTPVGMRGLAGAVYVGVFEMGLTFLLWQAALRHARNASSVGSLVFLSPFLSLLVIALVLEESILPATVIGLALIVGGIALQQWWGKGKEVS